MIEAKKSLRASAQSRVAAQVMANDRKPRPRVSRRDEIDRAGHAD